MPDVLLDVPSWLSAVIVCDWLAERSAIVLDNAYCAKRTRVLLLNAIKVAKLVLTVDDWMPAETLASFASSVTKRELSVCRLAWAGSLPMFSGLPFVLRVNETLLSIKLKSTPVMVALFGTTCSRIRIAELYNCSDRQALGIFLQGVQKTIERLVLSACAIHNDDTNYTKPVMHLMFFPCLAFLTLDNSFNEVWCSAFTERCPALQQMSFRASEVHISPKFPSSLKRLGMELRNPARYAEVLRATPLPDLEVLLLNGYSSYDGNLATVLPTWSTLYAIALRRTCLSDSFLEVVSQTLPNLHCVNIDSSCTFTAAGFARFLKACSQLTDLSVQSMKKVNLNDPLIIEALRAAVGLQGLDVGDNTLGPEIVSAIAQLPNLEELGVCGARFTALYAALDYIADRTARLRTVRVTKSTGVLLGSMWRKLHPNVNIVTNSSSSEFWCSLDFPTAPAVDVSCMAV
jgi:hypothetical protein